MARCMLCGDSFVSGAYNGPEDCLCGQGVSEREWREMSPDERHEAIVASRTRLRAEAAASDEVGGAD